MKKILMLIICLLICGCSNNTNNNQLNVLNWSSYIPDEVLKDFEKETNIKLNYSTYSSNEEALAKITSSKQGTYDMVFPSDYMVSLMIEKQMLEKIDKTKLINYENLDANYLSLEYDKNNDYSLPFLAATMVIAYNTENIKDNIESYNDLLNSKYKNNIVLIEDQRIIIGMALLALGYDMNEIDDKKLEEAKNWLLKLKKNVKAFDSDSPKTFLMTNEVDIGFLWNAEAALASQNNPNIKIVYPIEGFAISLDNYCILKGSKNTENAYKFINYLLREDVMAKIISSYPYKNVNLSSNKFLSESYLNNIASNMPNHLLSRANFVKNIGKNIEKYDMLWAEIK